MVIRKSLMTHFIKSVHLNGGTDGCRASPADGACTVQTNVESFSFYMWAARRSPFCHSSMYICTPFCEMRRKLWIVLYIMWVKHKST